MKSGEASFVTSVDLELGWGYNYEILKKLNFSSKYLRIIKERSRHNVRLLLEFSEKFGIPITWGVVGHLFLQSCTRANNGLPHPDMPRPVVDVNEDWYSNDPCSDVNVEPLWYACDVIEQILESSVSHEIACHSFSHVDFSRCSTEVAMSEIRKCKEIMKDYGVVPKTFIFPYNRLGHLNMLRQEGFRVFRFDTCPRYLPSRLMTLVDMVQETACPKVGDIIEVNGLIGVPPSIQFESPHGIDALRLSAVALRGINKAVNQKKIFHLTMHDSLQNDSLLHALSNVLSHVDKLRRNNRIHPKTMLQCCPTM